MLGFPIVMGIIQTFFLLFIYNYETPKFLYIRRKRRQCDIALGRIYTSEKDIDRVLSKLKAVTTNSGGSSEVSWKDLFGSYYVKALFVVFGIFY